ncbi:insulinase family protein [Flaviaesturariibacter flavus]|uniref:Insulinase family protein n=2 Tax=Flaviaesturariibacter flavus TaxID=2502780 RepID=A0A4R1B9C2_9BACT|nr:insulinase family protein [Flaviaesturariibacter flavus]
MKRNVLVLTGSLLLFAGAVRAQAKLVEKVTRKGSEIVIPYEKYVLPNGLTVLVHEDHSDPVVHVDVTYHVGSAREEIGKSGFAHFFEHMMFQGSDHVADEQHFKTVQGAGGTLNGSTNRDRTNYYETVPSNQVEKMLWLEADRMGFLLDAVTQKKFEVQRSTVKNERGQNYDNRPYGLASETISKNLYPYGHPYSWMTIGYLEDLNRSDVNDLKNFFLRWYGPNNATVSVGGDVKPAEIIRMVEKYFGSIPRGPEVTPVQVPSVSIDKDRYVTQVDNYARVPRLYLTLPTVRNYHPDATALDCLAEILGQGKNSVLYQTAVKKQLALQASAFQFNSELAGEFRFEIVPVPGKSLADMEKLLRDAFVEFEKRGVTDEDIAKFKGSNESQMINGLQSVSGKVSRLAAYQTFAGNPNKIADELAELRALKKEDVVRVYNQYIKGKGAVVLSVVPKSQEQLVAHEPNFTIDPGGYKTPDYGYAGLKYVKAKDNFDRAKMPAAGPAPVVKAPAFWKKEMANGMKAIGTFNDEAPTVAISLFIPGGHILQAKDLSKAGLASMVAAMMNEDTKNHTAEQVSVELQKLGASINVSSGLNGITINVQALKQNIDPVLALMEERLFRPNFSEEAFSRLKNQRIQGFKQMKSQPAAVADAVFAKVNYGPNHILGVSQVGTEETINNIQLKDVEAYYNNYITSQGARLVVVGDIRQAEVESKMAFLSKLPNKKIDLPKVDPAPAVDKTKVYLVDVPKGAQTEFRVGYATGLKQDATGDFYRATLANYALGGNFNSRLNLNLREDKGWTYGARSGFSGNQISGEFQFSSGIRADATDSALVEVMKDINNYVTNGPSDEELSFMKSAMGQVEALRYETPAQKAGFISRILEYNLPADYTVQQNKILSNIKKDELARVTRQRIQPEKLNILLVGDKARVLDKVKKLGYEVVELDADGKKVGEKKEF